MWEIIDNSSSRLQVPGGWIVKSWKSDCSGVSVHQVFVPDANHEWVLKK